MLVLVAIGCDDTEFPPPHGAGGGGVSGDTFADVLEVFRAECYTCHSAGAQLGGLDLETDPCATLLGETSAYGAPYVVPGDHEASVLWNKMADTGVYGPVMPPGGAPQASIDTVAAWIDAGASCGDTGGNR